ncbi:hypothetical protein PENTCL1PPCAC_23253, partial [Pristionchus entomophagus]
IRTPFPHAEWFTHPPLPLPLSVRPVTVGHNIMAPVKRFQPSKENRTTRRKLASTAEPTSRCKPSNTRTTKTALMSMVTPTMTATTTEMSKLLFEKGVNEEELLSKPPDMLTDDFYNIVGRAMRMFEWYHGYMSREGCEEYMKEVGDFLVRRTLIDGKPNYIMSVFVCKEGDKPKTAHIRIDYKAGTWNINENVKKASITQLIKHYQEKTSKYSDAPGPFLKKGVSRPPFYLLHENIHIGKQIGSGAFGTVHVGQLKKGTEIVEVAVKKMKSEKADKKKLQEFFKEGRLMLRFNHANIVRVFGVAPGDTPILIVLEFAKGGSLKSYCKNNDPVASAQLDNFAKDACRGMNYLQSMKVIHRDLAARNCLLGPNAELKISDFGLSHRGDSFQLDKLKSVPVKWLSPETLSKGKFSHKTDVWSYGMLLWEIYMRCKEDPFPKKNNAEAMELILNKKPPIDAPPNMPDKIKEVMMLSLTYEDGDRPDFEGVFKKLLPDETSPLIQRLKEDLF